MEERGDFSQMFWVTLLFLLVNRKKSACRVHQSQDTHTHTLSNTLGLTTFLLWGGCRRHHTTTNALTQIHTSTLTGFCASEVQRLSVSLWIPFASEIVVLIKSLFYGHLINIHNWHTHTHMYKRRNITAMLTSLPPREALEPSRPREPWCDGNIASETFLFPPGGLRYGLGPDVGVTAAKQAILSTINNNNQ